MYIRRSSRGKNEGRSSHLQIQLLFLVVGQELATKATFTELVKELNSSIGSNVLLKFLPSLPSVDQGSLQKL